MSAYSQIASWIPQTALAVDGAASDADGFWQLPYGRITLSLGIAEQADSILLYAPLMSVTGAEDASLAIFYKHLLNLQLTGSLPPGMAFGMDMDDTLVGMVGQYELKNLDLPAFDKLLRDVASAADELCAQLQSRFCEILNESASRQVPSSTNDSANAQLSDDELLRMRVMQDMHF